MPSDQAVRSLIERFEALTRGADGPLPQDVAGILLYESFTFCGDFIVRGRPATDAEEESAVLRGMTFWSERAPEMLHAAEFLSRCQPDASGPAIATERFRTWGRTVLNVALQEADAARANPGRAAVGERSLRVLRLYIDATRRAVNAGRVNERDLRSAYLQGLKRAGYPTGGTDMVQVVEDLAGTLVLFAAEAQAVTFMDAGGRLRAGWRQIRDATGARQLPVRTLDGAEASQLDSNSRIGARHGPLSESDPVDEAIRKESEAVDAVEIIRLHRRVEAVRLECRQRAKAAEAAFAYRASRDLPRLRWPQESREAVAARYGVSPKALRHAERQVATLLRIAKLTG